MSERFRNEGIYNGMLVPRMLDRLQEYEAWRYPIQYNKNTEPHPDNKRITSEQFTVMEYFLASEFRERVLNSGLAHTEGKISFEDLKLASEITNAIPRIQHQIVSQDPSHKNETWNPSVTRHITMVEASAWATTRQVNAKNPSVNLDIYRQRVKAKLHDLGRAVTHDPIYHGLAGREIAKSLGLSADIQRTISFHIEAACGPGFWVLSPEEVNLTPMKLDEIVAEAPLEEVVITTSDTGQKGVQQADGSFVNTITHPVVGLVSASKRRLTIGATEPDSEMLMDLASADIEVRQTAMDNLEASGTSRPELNKVSMYFGIVGAMVRRLERNGVVYEGRSGVIAQAKRDYKSILAGK